MAEQSGIQPRLLVADDDPGVLAATSTWLTRNGYEVTGVSGRDSVLEALRETHYDLLLADIHMPGNNELQLVRDLHTIEPTLPVVLMTGYPSVASAVKALKLRAVDYLLKPIEPDVLLRAVEEGLKKSKYFRAVGEAHSQLLAWAESLKQLAAGSGEVVPTRTCGAPAPAGLLDNLPDAERAQLSPRECDVIQQLASGLRVNDAAKALSISPHTVRSHLKSIFRKLKVDSQIELLGKLHNHTS